MDPVTIVDKDGDEALYVEPKEGSDTEQADLPEEPLEAPAPEAPAEEAPAKIKIGEQEYTPEEAQELLSKGSKIKEWETKMPGFDVDKFMPDYTQKSQRLAVYEKRTAPKAQVDAKELEDLGVDEAQIKSFEKVAKHLGFVKQADLVEDSVEAQKESFLSRHPEYAPGSPVNDQRWTQLTQEFNMYDWKNHPDKVEKFLEKAHSEVSKSWESNQRNIKTQETVVTKKALADAAASSGGGGGSGTGAPKAPVTTSNEAELYRKAGWSEEQIKEFLT